MMKALADKRWLTSRLATSGAWPHVIIFTISLAWLAAVYGAACLDGTTKLPVPGKGFRQHNGYIVLHLMAPVALSLSLLALERFSRLLEKPEPHFIRGAGKQQFREFRDKQLESLNLHSGFIGLLALGIVTGAICTTLVLMQVINPFATYGNDVFNALRYPYGYYAANTYLGLTWTVIIPFSLYIVLHITISMALVLHRARELQVLHIDLFHPDNCGGLSDFGDLNLLLTLYYAPIIISILALAETHIRRYTSLLLPASILPIILVTQAVIGVVAMYRAVQTEKQKRLEELKELLDETLGAPKNAGGGTTALLLWRHIHDVNAMPYSDSVRFIQLILPALTLAVGIIQIKLM